MLLFTLAQSVATTRDRLSAAPANPGVTVHTVLDVLEGLVYFILREYWAGPTNEYCHILTSINCFAIFSRVHNSDNAIAKPVRHLNICRLPFGMTCRTCIIGKIPDGKYSTIRAADNLHRNPTNCSRHSVTCFLMSSSSDSPNRRVSSLAIRLSSSGTLTEPTLISCFCFRIARSSAAVRIMRPMTWLRALRSASVRYIGFWESI